MKVWIDVSKTFAFPWVIGLPGFLSFSLSFEEVVGGLIVGMDRSVCDILRLV